MKILDKQTNRQTNRHSYVIKTHKLSLNCPFFSLTLTCCGALPYKLHSQCTSFGKPLAPLYSQDLH